MNKITIWNPKEATIFKCKKNTSENSNYTNTDNIENIQNKIAKRLILLTEDESIKWEIASDIFRPEYVKLLGKGTKDKTLNFKYCLYINKTSVDKSYFLYTAKNMQNDWAMLYPCEYDGTCIYPEQEIFIQRILNVLEEKKVLIWIKGDL